MTSDRIRHAFRLMAKFIKLDQLSAAHASGIKTHMVATNDQFAQQGGGVDLYDDLISVVIPLAQRVTPTVQGLERVGTMAKAATETYLRTIGSELDQPATASVPTILTALKNDMADAGQTIYPSGTFFNYFNANFAFNQFPTSPTPTIEDGWVSSVVIV